MKIKKHLNLKKDVNTKKMVLVFSKLLVLFLISGLSISTAYAAPSEENVSLDIRKSGGDQTAASLKSGLSPVNPDSARQNAGQILTKALTLGGHGTGLAASPVDLTHLSAISSIGFVSAPVSYDLRNTNKVIYMENQGSAGSFRALATYGSLESDFMSGENRDFSENNMKNLLSSSYSEGFDRSSSGGGNHLISTAYLARWTGPVAESADTYSDVSTSSPTGLALQKHVQDVFFIPNRQGPLDNDGIKQAVQNYGALYTTMCYDNAYYSSARKSYYYTGEALPLSS